MDLESIEQPHNIYTQFIQDIPFQEIEHVPNDFISNDIVLEQKCLCISHRFFDQYYPTLIQILSKSHQTYENLNWVCEMILVMNGENDKAWNIKKGLLQSNLLDIQRERRFNAAVCYKNKKSSSYYDYRLRVIDKLCKIKLKKELLQLYQLESKLIFKILGRFFRNYYCWMYRNRLFKMLVQICGQQVVDLQVKQLHKWIQNNPNDYSAYSRLITIVRDYPALAQQQIIWLQQLLEFCNVAYQSKSSYLHTETYRQYLIGITPKIKTPGL